MHYNTTHSKSILRLSCKYVGSNSKGLRVEGKHFHQMNTELKRRGPRLTAKAVLFAATQKKNLREQFSPYVWSDKIMSLCIVLIWFRVRLPTTTPPTHNGIFFKFKPRTGCFVSRKPQGKTMITDCV